ncbi:hypothetical protein FRB90_002415 [Tulasnella sp. 427]|nr:hypothetical protein FRB90_002415 [Tulasnella sp. 427]
MSDRGGESRVQSPQPQQPQHPLNMPATSYRSIPSRFTLPKSFELLQGSSNWDTWAFKFMNVFEAEGAWKIVTGAEKEPTKDGPQRDVWVLLDRAARITIALYLAEPCIPHVATSTSSAASWKALSDAYKPKGLLTAFHYRNQLVTARFNEAQPIGPQIDQLRQLRVKQITAGIPCEDWDFAICLLGALPESYSVTKQAILASQTDLHKLNLASIVTLIMQDEMEKKGYISSVDTDAAFAARQGRQPRQQPRQHRQQQQPQPTNPQQPRKEEKRTGACNWCKRKGHWESDCNKKKEMQVQAQQGADVSNKRQQEKQKLKAQKSEPSAVDLKMWTASLSIDLPASENANATTDANPTAEWWEFDSGATRVFHGNLAAFSNYKPFSKPLRIGLASDKDSLNALGSGSLTIKLLPPNGPPVPITISKAFYAPGIVNLISISHLNDHGRRVVFSNKRIKVWHGTNLELSLDRVGNLYRCRGEIIFPEKAQSAKTDVTAWHRRWGHMGITSLKEIARKDLVSDFDLTADQISGSEPCDPCIRGKHSRTPFPKTGRTRATKPLELVHTDICGPFPTSRKGYKYYQPYLDDNTDWGVVYWLKAKSDAATSLKDYHVRAENHTGNKLMTIRSDNGDEFEGDFERHCTLHGIQHQRTTVYTPQQNGVAEWLNRTLNDGVVSCLLDANMGDEYWADAVLYMMYTRNRSPSRSIPGFVPYTLWNKETKPSVAHLRPFGCTAYVHVPKKVRKGKRAPKSIKTVFLGYDANRKAYAVLLYAATLTIERPTLVDNDSSSDDDDEDTTHWLPIPTAGTTPGSSAPPSTPASTVPSTVQPANPPLGNPPAPAQPPTRPVGPPALPTQNARLR